MENLTKGGGGDKFVRKRLELSRGRRYVIES
jgi:hypothetical protein